MARNNQFGGKRVKRKANRDGRGPAVREVPVYERKAPVEYGKPFIVMEDPESNTFAYDGSAWVPFSMTMADCKAECQVKTLPQKVNGKTRYEVRLPINKA